MIEFEKASLMQIPSEWKKWLTENSFDTSSYYEENQSRFSGWYVEKWLGKLIKTQGITKKDKRSVLLLTKEDATLQYALLAASQNDESLKEFVKEILQHQTQRKKKMSKNNNTSTKTLVTKLSEELHTRVKVAATLKHKSMGAYVQDALLRQMQEDNLEIVEDEDNDKNED